MQIEKYNEDLDKYMHLLSEAKEGRYDLYGYDIHVIEAALQQYQEEAKKTDFDRFVDLYESSGVKYETCNGSAGKEIKIEVCDGLAATKEQKVFGYAGYFTILFFDENGKFNMQKIQE